MTRQAYRAYQRKWRELHPGYQRSYNRAWMREWRRRNPSTKPISNRALGPIQRRCAEILRGGLL